jgi:hypothetical protein
MLPANSPADGKASHKRKATPSNDGAELSTESPAENGKTSAAPPLADVKPEAKPKKAAAKPSAGGARPRGGARKPPMQRGAPLAVAGPGVVEPSGGLEAAEADMATCQAADGSKPAPPTLLVLPPPDAAIGKMEDQDANLANGHAAEAQPGAAAMSPAAGPGEGVPLLAALPCRKKGGWPKGKPRRNHVPTGKVPSSGACSTCCESGATSTTPLQQRAP